MRSHLDHEKVVSRYRRLATEEIVQAIRWKGNNLPAIAAFAGKTLLGEIHGRLVFAMPDAGGKISVRVGYGQWLVVRQDGKAMAVTHSCFEFAYKIIDTE